MTPKFPQNTDDCRQVWQSGAASTPFFEIIITLELSFRFFFDRLFLRRSFRPRRQACGVFGRNNRSFRSLGPRFN